MLSTREVAERLGVSQASVRRWSDSGRLPVRRVGKRRERRFKVDDIDGLATQPKAAVLPTDRARLALAGEMVAVPFHVATFYDSDPGRLRLTIPFLADGIRAGQPTFLIAHGRYLDDYLNALRRSDGADVDSALETGVLTVFPGPGKTAEEALDFWETNLWKALDRHATLMRGVGEMAAVRQVFESEQEMLRFEAALDTVLRRFPIAAICQYDVREFSGRAILAAMRAHPDMLDVSLSLLIK